MALGSERHRTRQAIGIFHEASRVRQAWLKLADAGFRPRDFSLLGRREAVEQAELLWHCSLLSETRAESAGRLELVTEIDADSNLVGCGRLVRWLIDDMAADAAGKARLWLAQWLPQRAATALQDQIGVGAVLLWIEVEDGEAERRACKVLMQESRNHVQVHDMIFVA